MKREELIHKIDTIKSLFEENEESLLRIDKRIRDYIYDNLYHSEKHGNYEILACIRFIKYFENYDFSITSYRRYIKFVEQLQIPSENGMQSFKLEPFQAFFAAVIWGWKDHDGSNLVKDCMLFIPRKASKSSMIAQLAVYSLLFGADDGQIYCSSNSFNQSKIIFDIITSCIKSIDPKMRSFRRTRDKIYSIIQGKQSFIQCLSNCPDRLDGLNSLLNIFDELSQAKDFSVKRVLESSQGARKNHYNITITTASTNMDGPFVEFLANNKKILEDKVRNDSFFALIFEAEDTDDISNPEVWHRVQPMLGISVRERYYADQYEKAKMCAEDMVEFKTKLLNIFTVQQATQWIKPAMVKRNQKDFKLEMLTGKPICFVSYDLSVSDDMSAVTWCCYDSINHTFAFYSKAYLPKQTIENHHNKELYRKWVDDGYLTICGDEVIDYTQIADDIYKSTQYVNIIQIGYDAYKNRELTNTLRAYGFKNLQSYRQTISEFTSPCEALEIGLAENKIIIDNNPIINWCFGNAVIDTDNIGNKKPIKISANRKIDIVITILMCLGMAMNFKR